MVKRVYGPSAPPAGFTRDIAKSTGLSSGGMFGPAPPPGFNRLSAKSTGLSSVGMFGPAPPPGFNRLSVKPDELMDTTDSGENYPRYKKRIYNYGVKKQKSIYKKTPLKSTGSRNRQKTNVKLSSVKRKSYTRRSKK